MTLQTYFEYLEYDWPRPPKLIVSIFRTGWCLSACKNRLYPSLLSWHITKILQHVWLWLTYMIISVFRKLWCSSSWKKSNYRSPLFLEILLSYWVLAFLGTLGKLGYGHQKWWSHFLKNFIFMQEIKFIPHFIL